MHIHFLDSYRSRSSPVHLLDPRVKFVLVIAFILTTTLTPIGAWPVYILLFSVILSIEVISEIGVGYVLKRSSLAIPFVLAALPVIFTTPGQALLSFHFLGSDFTASLPGVERFASIAFKSWISVQAAIILASTTPFPDLLAAMRGVGVPRLLVAIFGLMWRYMFVLADETLRLLRARSARSGSSGLPGTRPGGNLIWRARVTGGMAGNLFLRAFERSDRIYMAMLARGYNGEARLLPLPSVSRSSWLVLGAGLTLFASLLILAFLF